MQSDIAHNFKTRWIVYVVTRRISIKMWLGLAGVIKEECETDRREVVNCTFLDLRPPNTSKILANKETFTCVVDIECLSHVPH